MSISSENASNRMGLLVFVVGSYRLEPTFEPSRVLQIQYKNKLCTAFRCPDWDREGIVRH